MSTVTRRTLPELLSAPGGSERCPVCPSGLIFHLYDDEGENVIGVTCHACDWHRYRAGDPPREEGPRG